MSMPHLDETRPNRPLAGITVLDFGQIYQGPYASFLLAKAGANVIKIEPPNGEASRLRAKVGRGASLPMATPGLPAGPASSSPFRCSRASSVACSSKG